MRWSLGQYSDAIMTCITLILCTIHGTQVQQQLRQQQQQQATLGQLNASAASRATAQRKALEELIRAEEICKILNSFDFTRAASWL